MLVTTGIASPNSFRPRGFPFFLPTDDDNHSALKFSVTKPTTKVLRTLRTPRTPRTVRPNPAATDIEPFWMKFVEGSDVVATSAAAAGKKKRGRPPTAHTNSLKRHLSGFNAPGFVLASLPFFDNIVTGAVNLDMKGNTRPLAKKVIVSMLQRLDVISTRAVQDYMHSTSRQCSGRHAMKIALCLRVIEKAAASIAEDQWPMPTTFEIEPCGKVNCSVCARSGTEAPTPDAASHVSDDSDFSVETENWAEAD